MSTYPLKRQPGSSCARSLGLLQLCRQHIKAEEGGSAAVTSQLSLTEQMRIGHTGQACVQPTKRLQGGFRLLVRL